MTLTFKLDLHESS